MYEKKREERKEIYSKYVLKKRKKIKTVADRCNAKLFNICVYSVYVL